MKESLLELIQHEGWEVKGNSVLVYNKKFPVTHPALIHLKLYRTEVSADIRYRHLKAAHDYLWPQDIKTWHYWTERRFKEHCAGHNYIGWAGGASTTKSYDAAKIICLFWLSNPQKRAVVVASTTLESLTARVWGYTTKLLSTLAIKMPFQYLSGNSPKILYPSEKGSGEIRDTIHGIYAVAAKQGSDETAISSWIGRHPDDALLVILDECTDLNPAIAKALPNLDSSEKPFQLIAIGNSNSVHDLHGAICTPKDGWDSVDPIIHNKWETTQKNGICLFFSCYESPAIYEQDLGRKRALSKFLLTQDQIEEKEKLLGKNSESFYRFVLGFWKSKATESTIISDEFINVHQLAAESEWSGQEELRVFGGLDAAFSTGGDKCILRLAYLGQTINGDMVLDYRHSKLLFNIQIQANSLIPAELQIARQVIDILAQYSCPLHNIAIDASGQGRALGGTLMLEAKQLRPPIKVYTTRHPGRALEKDKAFDVVPKGRYELWFDMRRFAEQGSIKGLDSIATQQFTSRLIVRNPKTGREELESKADYKRRMGAIQPSLAHSPDEADAAALCLLAAMTNAGFYPGQKKALQKIEPGFMQEIAAWKANVRMIQEQHLKGPELGFPNADFSGGIDAILRANKQF